MATLSLTPVPFEQKELSVPLDKTEELRKFYRVIAGDERNTVVLKPTP
jgi:hypothetical protein